MSAVARSERGVALPLALFALVMLSGLLLVLLSMGAMEPAISANLNDITRARYLADAGIEWGYDQLVLAVTQPAGWSGVLAQNNGQMANNLTLPGLTAVNGTFSVTVRNDNQPNDTLITGQPLDTGNNVTDTNNIVILTSTGSYNGATRQIQAVVTGMRLTPYGGLNLPGLGTNTSFSGNAFTISGNDTNLDDTAGSCSARYGLGVGNAVTEALVEASLSPQQLNNIVGKAQNPGPGVGANTIAPDGSLTPAQIAQFVTDVMPYANITLQASGTSRLQYSDIGSPCATDVNAPTCWGTRSNPKIVYVKGTPDPLQSFYALSLSGNSSGVGILIVEDGDLNITGNFHWEGTILVTGQNVGLRYGGGGDQTIYGGIVVNETAAVNSHVEVDAMGNAKVFYSCQALNIASSSRGLTRLKSWREL